MSFKNMKLTETEVQRNEREMLIQTLLDNIMIQEFLNKYNAPRSVIEANPYRFKTWLMERAQAEAATEETIAHDERQGAYVDLVYDHETQSLMEVLVHSSILTMHEAKTSYLSAYKVFDLPLQLRSATFSSINLNKENPKYLSAMETALSVTPQSEGLFLYGDLGVGKTYLAACITNTLAKAGHSIVFVAVSELIAYIKSTFGTSYEFDRVMNALKFSDCVVFDDLGSEPITTWSRDEILFPIINARMENKRLTLFTSNYAMDDLELAYATDSRGNVEQLRAKRLVDRIRNITKAVEVVGDNRRFVK